jgi:acetamidase/formamidase
MRIVSRPERLSKVNCTFSPNNKPILKVQPGETLQIETYDAFGYVDEPDFDLSSKLEKKETLFDNPVTGPIWIEEAEPGDTLSVEIIDIRVRDYGVTTITPGIGAFDEWLTKTPIITKISKIRDGRIIYTTESGRKISFPLKPFIGVIGVAPLLESISTETPFKHGGNMDIGDICPGNTLFLPISVGGALFSVGDVHASQGDGEICGTAVEVSATVTLKLDLIKGKTIQWPRIESDKELMVACSARPLEDAARLAFRELIYWLEEYGISTHDAYMLLSLVAKARIAQIVDPLYTVVAKINKEYLR